MGGWERGPVWRPFRCGFHWDPLERRGSASPNPSVVVGDLAPKRLKLSLLLFLFFNMEMIPVTWLLK